MSAMAIGELFAFLDTERFNAVWGRVPEEKLAFYSAAEATIRAANDVYTPAPEGLSDAATTYWERGYADRLIASVESACSYWKMSEGAYIEAVERISAWLEAKGWTHLKHPAKETLAYADRVHNTAETLRRTALGSFKGSCGTAHNRAASK